MWFHIIILLFSITIAVIESAIVSLPRLFSRRCQLIQGDCPHENIHFWLYTREIMDAPLQLDTSNVSNSQFRPGRPVYILIHGYTGHRDFAPNNYIRPALLQESNSDPMVISMDYGPLVPSPCYVTAVENLPLASKCLAHFINNLVDSGAVNNNDIHLIGFSLGAQVAGQTANYVKQKLSHITGLDPAKPLFVTVAQDRRLDAGDANFVDVIHTDVLGRGMLRNMGHVDFYPNIGSAQPGCLSTSNVGSCNHDRAPRYYAESIHTDVGFWAYHCRSWLHQVLGLCSIKSNDQQMGFHVNRSLHGSFFLKTSNHTPFALGPFSLRINADSLQSTHYPDYSLNNPELYNDLVFEYVDSNPFVENDFYTNTV